MRFTFKAWHWGRTSSVVYSPELFSFRLLTPFPVHSRVHNYRRCAACTSYFVSLTFVCAHAGSLLISLCSHALMALLPSSKRAGFDTDYDWPVFPISYGLQRLSHAFQLPAHVAACPFHAAVSMMVLTLFSQASLLRVREYFNYSNLTPK